MRSLYGPPPCKIDLERLWETVWEIQHLLPHPDDEGVDADDALALRQFNRYLAGLSPLEVHDNSDPKR